MDCFLRDFNCADFSTFTDVTHTTLNQAGPL